MVLPIHAMQSPGPAPGTENTISNKLETLPHEGDDGLSNEWLVQCGWRYVLQQIRVVAALKL